VLPTLNERPVRLRADATAHPWEAAHPADQWWIWAEPIQLGRFKGWPKSRIKSGMAIQ
jgi:hypothetical protein